MVKKIFDKVGCGAKVDNPVKGKTAFYGQGEKGRWRP